MGSHKVVITQAGMYLPQREGNSTWTELWQTIFLDNHTCHGLPMMNSIAWPFGIGCIHFMSLVIFRTPLHPKGETEAVMILHGYKNLGGRYVYRKEDGVGQNIYSAAILFIYHCVQFGLEMAIILAVIFHYFQRADPESSEDFEVIMAHYFYFLITVNQYIFLYFSCMFSKFTENSCKVSTEKI